MLIVCTYSRGFFFGPGLPLARALGSVWPFARLLPGLGPGTPFRREVSPGVAAPVAGVEVASALESLSAEGGRTAGTSVDEAGEERSLALSAWDEFEVLRSGPLSAKVWRTSGASLNLTTRLLEAFLAPPALLERPLLVDAAAGIVMMMRRIVLEYRKIQGG